LNLPPFLTKHKAAILQTAAKYGASNIRLFGSAIRGEAGPQSDVDFLADMEIGRSLLDQIALKQDLEDLLGRQVDIVVDRNPHWYIRDRVLSEAKPL